MKDLYQKSLVIIKPDGVQRSLIGEVVKRFEQVGLKLTAMKFEIAGADKIRKHYTIDPDWVEKTGKKALIAMEKDGENIKDLQPFEVGEDIIKRLIKYFASGPVVIMVWEGVYAIEVIRKLVGGTEPRTSDVGTIRGDFVHDSYAIANHQKRSVRNVVHASSSLEDAEKELKVWFHPEEIIDYRLISQEILQDVNLDNIKE